MGRPSSSGSEPHGQRVAQTGVRAVPHPGDVSIGSDQESGGGCHLTQDRELPVAAVLGVDGQHTVCPR